MAKKSKIILMKKYLLFALIILLASCSTNNTATDSQRSWCIAREVKIVNLLENWSLSNQFTQEELDFIDEYRVTHYAALDIYENDYQVDLSNYSNHLTKLYDNEDAALRICKIDADINNID